MAWLRSEQSLAGHPKTKRAARALSISIPAMIGHLHCLWYWAMDYAPEGDLGEFEDWELGEAALYEGDPAGFIEALISAGFIDQDRKIHDWYEYAGRLIEQREANAERMRAKRAAHVQATCSARTGATNEEDVTDVTNVTDDTNKEEGPAAGLLAFTLQALPPSQSTTEDYRRTLDRHALRLPRSQIERIICELAEFTPKKPRDRLHLTLNKWLAKEQPEGGDHGRPTTRSGRSQNGEF